jgi:hypothetical protein
MVGFGSPGGSVSVHPEALARVEEAHVARKHPGGTKTKEVWNNKPADFSSAG